jgi:NTP pyrophosphatase (non-canonical NTP hydrolase)
MSLDALDEKILEWGLQKGILPHAEPLAQLDKTEEEVGELRQAIYEHDVDEVKDAIGDIYVTITMQAEAWGFTMEECVQAAYDVIKRRTGKMVNGKFVKDT